METISFQPEILNYYILWNIVNIFQTSKWVSVTNIDLYDIINIAFIFLYLKVLHYNLSIDIANINNYYGLKFEVLLLLYTRPNILNWKLK